MRRRRVKVIDAAAGVGYGPWCWTRRGIIASLEREKRAWPHSWVGVVYGKNDTNDLEFDDED